VPLERPLGSAAVMTEQSHTGPPDLQTRLVEIDARLREIQAGLAPDREPPPAEPPQATPAPTPAPSPQATSPPPPPAPPVGPAPPALAPAPPALADPHAKLLSSMRELLDAYGLALAQLGAPAAPAPAAAGAALSAGPFASTDAVRAFERALATVPGVLEVRLRGYEGENRAVFDVHVSGTSA
jgi:hypothetical protein